MPPEILDQGISLDSLRRLLADNLMQNISKLNIQKKVKKIDSMPHFRRFQRQEVLDSLSLFNMLILENLQRN